MNPPGVLLLDLHVLVQECDQLGDDYGFVDGGIMHLGRLTLQYGSLGRKCQDLGSETVADADGVFRVAQHVAGAVFRWTRR